MATHVPYEVAIDPLVFIIPSDKLQYLWEYLHPHTPLVEAINKVVGTMTAAEKETAVARAKIMIEYSNAVQEAVAKSKAAK